ncbi:hypothetical protein PybrP1_007545 [[Pythium] brassicae (nom. inval.)]|nr:hypothetical protein PybrP1_007545 [[Pythium] brassicae (nom. inval.)]
MLGVGSSNGRKREWRPIESEDADGHHGGSRGAHGEAIEKEMKKLRLAHDYDASRSTWNASADALGLMVTAEPMEVEDDAAHMDGDHNYAAKNNVLRECHYLRQLRRFQSERLPERTSFIERRPGGMDAASQYPPQPRY